MKARAMLRHSSSGEMNGTESAYAATLRTAMHDGSLFYFAYEPITLRLAKATRYTPDFLVITSDGRVELHEVKGFWREDARVKFKVAAALFPFFVFVAAQRDESNRNGWKIETLNGEKHGKE